MSNSTVDIQGQLVQLDNLMNGLNYLYEELESRKGKIFSEESLTSRLKKVIEDYDYMNQLANNIIRWYGEDSALDRVAISVMRSIDNDIEAFINARVESRLKELGVI